VFGVFRICFNGIFINRSHGWTQNVTHLFCKVTVVTH
jgi:hypothetical protein